MAFSKYRDLVKLFCTSCRGWEVRIIEPLIVAWTINSTKAILRTDISTTCMFNKIHFNKYWKIRCRQLTKMYSQTLKIDQLSLNTTMRREFRTSYTDNSQISPSFSEKVYNPGHMSLKCNKILVPIWRTFEEI